MKRRAHGLEGPLHPLQMISWAVFGLDVLLFNIVVLPLVADADARTAATVSFALSTASLVLSTARATSCDPALGLKAISDGAIERLCSDCNAPAGSRTKHCYVCNKCVDVFDHHCMWLNNCIGVKNYRAFLVAIFSAAAFTVVVLATCALVCTSSVTDRQGFELLLARSSARLRVPWQLLVWFLGFVMIVNLPLFVLDMQLVVLHLLLIRQDLTTYEYIVSKYDQEMLEQEEELPDKLGAESVSAEKRTVGAAAAAAGAASRRAIRRLPSCVDWIVFARCGRRRRRRRHKPSLSEETEPTTVEVAQLAEAAGVAQEGLQGALEAAIAEAQQAIGCAEASAGSCLENRSIAADIPASFREAGLPCSGCATLSAAPTPQLSRACGPLPGRPEAWDEQGAALSLVAAIEEAVESSTSLSSAGRAITSAARGCLNCDDQIAIDVAQDLACASVATDFGSGRLRPTGGGREDLACFAWCSGGLCSAAAEAQGLSGDNFCEPLPIVRDPDCPPGTSKARCRAEGVAPEPCVSCA